MKYPVFVIDIDDVWYEGRRVLSSVWSFPGLLLYEGRRGVASRDACSIPVFGNLKSRFWS